MKKIFTLIGAVFALTLSTASVKAKTLLETAKGAENFTILTKAVQAAGLEDALSGNTKLTVFAPTDEAFMRLPKGTLQTLLKPENKEMLINILTYHVVAGEVKAKTAVSLDEATALNKQKINVAFKNAALYLNESKVIATDIQASNGVIHVIDNVLLPANLKAASKKSNESASLTILNDAVDIGVDLFNNGDQKACAIIYEIAVRAVVEIKPKELSQANMNKLSSALKTVSKSNDHRENAWTLRDAIDSAFRDLE